MSSWILVPCLVTLRAEFDALSPGRRRSSDGTIGDRAHADTSSDHNPDETGRTPSEDVDDLDEVHALDVDSDLRCAGWPMSRAVGIIVDRHRRGVDDRLQNVIYDRRIASRSWGWTWRPYAGPSPHTEHAHFSSRYTSAQEADTSPWGLLAVQEDEMPTAAEISTAIWSHPLPAPTGAKSKTWTPAEYLTHLYAAGISARTYSAESRTAAAQGVQLMRALSALAASEATEGDTEHTELVDRMQQLLAATAATPALTAAAVLDGLDPAAIAAAIPDDLARQVVDALGQRLTA